MNSTTEHCARIATASPMQLHIKTKISKTKRKLVKFRLFCESPHTSLQSEACNYCFYKE